MPGGSDDRDWDLDRDGEVTDLDLALAVPPTRWQRIGLRGPAIVLRWFTRNAKRLAVLLLGGAVLLAGVAMLVLPGPGVLIIIAGLAILATEFAWAERALDLTTARAGQALHAVSSRAAGRGLLALSGGAMVAGGIVVAVFSSWRTAGVSLTLAGAIALVTLTPPMQRWLAVQQAKRSSMPGGAAPESLSAPKPPVEPAVAPGADPE